MKKKLDIIYWDQHYIAVTKPAGILVHPYKEKSQDRRHLMRSLKKQTGLYLYPIHRLDKAVSGIVIFALSKEATRRIKENWNTDDTTKKYFALCRSEIHEHGEFTFDLKSQQGVMQSAYTSFKRVATNGDYSLVDITIKTGRMHQIRRHFSRRMFNLIGDAKYGHGSINKIFKDKYRFFRIFLHAYELQFIHPFTLKTITLRTRMPQELTEIIEDQGLLPDSLTSKLY